MKPAAPGEAAERVALEEWSGPVSPRYQYKTRIVVTRVGSGAHLVYDHQGVYSEGKPTEKRAADREIPAAACDELWTALEGAGLFSLEDTALPADTRARVGISINRLEASRGGRHARIEYTLASLKKADGSAKRALVELVKAWAEKLAAAAPIIEKPASR